MKTLFLSFLITLTSFTASAKERVFKINSGKYEIVNASVLLHCIDRNPIQEVLSMGHGGYYTRKTEERPLIIKNNNDGTHDLTLNWVFKRYPNKFLINTKCYTSFIIEAMDPETGEHLNSSKGWSSHHAAYYTSVPGRSLRKVNKRMKPYTLCPSNYDSEGKIKLLKFCKDGDYVYPRNM